MNSKASIPISALVVFGTITLADIQVNGRLPGSREWLGFIVVYTMLSAASDFGLSAANGFAILVMLTVLLTRGLEALQFVNGKVAPTKTKKKDKAPLAGGPSHSPQKA